MGVAGKGTSKTCGEWYSRGGVEGSALEQRSSCSPEPARSHTQQRYWLLVGRGPRYGRALTIGGKLAVFSSEEEAESFVARRAQEDGWRVEQFCGGELISALYGPLRGFESVALDPLPEAAERTLDELVSISREEFTERLVCGERSRSGEPPGSRPATNNHDERRELDEQMSEAAFEGEGPQFSTVLNTRQGAPVIKVHGEIDLSTVPQLLDAIGKAGPWMDGLALAVVDLRRAQFIDAYGVRSLIEQVQAMCQLGGELRLVIPEEGPVGHVFEVLGVDRELDLYHDLNLLPDVFSDEQAD